MNCAHKAAIMENEELVKCPLCEGIAKVRRSDLAAWLAGNNLREKLETKTEEFTSLAKRDQEMRRPKPGEFGNQVHHWNPNLPLWNRSPKE
jgi:hypothetical protein